MTKKAMRSCYASWRGRRVIQRVQSTQRIWYRGQYGQHVLLVGGSRKRPRQSRNEGCSTKQVSARNIFFSSCSEGWGRMDSRSHPDVGSKQRGNGRVAWMTPSNSSRIGFGLYGYVFSEKYYPSMQGENTHVNRNLYRTRLKPSSNTTPVKFPTQPITSTRQMGEYECKTHTICNWQYTERQRSHKLLHLEAE